jgi:hypothetical protein
MRYYLKNFYIARRQSFAGKTGPAIIDHLKPA